MEKNLCDRIPSRGTVAWAKYVEEHYETDFFTPVDLFLAGQIIERIRWQDDIINLIYKSIER